MVFFRNTPDNTSCQEVLYLGHIAPDVKGTCIMVGWKTEHYVCYKRKIFPGSTSAEPMVGWVPLDDHDRAMFSSLSNPLGKTFFGSKTNGAVCLLIYV